VAYRAKMDRAQRAKQFMPFAALKGYEDALRAKEKVVVSKQELTEEQEEELNRQLLQIQKRDMITVVYFEKDEYLKVTGMVSRIDRSAQILQVVNTKIEFANIAEIYQLVQN